MGGLALVLRSATEALDANSRHAAVSSVNHVVIYQRGLDLTADIRRELASAGEEGVAKQAMRAPRRRIFCRPMPGPLVSFPALA